MPSLRAFIPVLAALAVAAPASAARAATLVVPTQYKTIQSAVNAARPGDTVLINGGVYHEGVVVSTSNLSLVGSQGATLDGTGLGIPVPDTNLVVFGPNGITVQASCVSICGLTIQNYSYPRSFVEGDNAAGIQFLSGTGGQASGDTVRSNMTGIEVKAPGVHLDSNTVTKNATDGLLLANNVEASYNTITANSTTAGTGSGINISQAEGCDIEYNLIANNQGIGVGVATGSTAQGSPQTGSDKIAGNLILNNAGYGIDLSGAENQNVLGNVISGNSTGVFVTGASDNSTVSGNLVSNNGGDGIYVDFGGATNVTFSYNVVNANGYDGIEVAPANFGNTFTYDTGKGNGNFDAEDETFDGSNGSNTWAHDQFGKTNPPGLGR